MNRHPLAPRLVPRQPNPGAPPPSAAVHLTPCPVREPKEEKVKTIRFAIVMTMTLMILALGSGLAQALPILRPNWKPNW